MASIAVNEKAAVVLVLWGYTRLKRGRGGAGVCGENRQGCFEAHLFQGIVATEHGVEEGARHGQQRVACSAVPKASHIQLDLGGGKRIRWERRRRGVQIKTFDRDENERDQESTRYEEGMRRKWSASSKN